MNYAFIDSQNLNLGVRSMGWRLDYRKFRLYLRNKYKVEKAFLFIGLIANNQRLYTELQSAGFILVFKPTIRYFQNEKETVKGNVDSELVLHVAAIEYSNYKQAIIVTGDGDFACLMEFLIERKKLLQILAPTSKYSQLLRPYASFITQIGELKTAIEYKKTGISGRSKP
ncbi:NYN domain-containing protein [Patescibacteria group bacterium]|nr:NYN domain-containing protein [Patescibacteria group bacterium]